jgi:hypothetical protein
MDALFKKYRAHEKNGFVYDTVLAPLRDIASHVLEIGVDGGGSLCAWVDYFPNAKVVGLDLTLQRYLWGAAHPRITVFQADATEPTTVPWTLVSKKYDVIIDDSCNGECHVTLKIFGKLLAPGGVYVIERPADCEALALVADSMRMTLECVHDMAVVRHV